MSNESSQSLDSPASEAVMARLLDLENRTGYRMQQCNGQRKYWNPNWIGSSPQRGSEVFVGKIPRDLFEDELVPVFETVGKIYELRLMMDFSGYNRGYAFVTYTTKEDAIRAIEMLDNYEIRPGMKIGVCRSVDNCRLFVGSIPKDKSQEEIRQAMCEVTDDVNDVIVYPGTNPGEKNRGFAFVEYASHRAAAMARRKLIPGRITLFGYEVAVDWADPESDVNDDLMNRVKNVYVRNLKPTTSEFTVWAAFNNVRPGSIERVKKIEDRDFAFVHFHKREDALYAIQMMNGQVIDGLEIHVSLAKPNAMTKHTLGNKTILHGGMQMQNNGQTFCPGNDSLFNTSNMMLNLPSMQQMQSSQTFNMMGNNMNSFSVNSNDMGPMCTLRGFQNMSRSSTPALPNNSVAAAPNRVLPSIRPTFGVQNNLGWKSGLTQPSERRLRPAVTMDHLASIKCPVTLLTELFTRLNWGCPPPQYALFIDDQSNGQDPRSGQGGTQYVYQIQFSGNTYTPPTSSDTVEEARRIADKYVLDQLGPQLKLKLETLVNKNNNRSAQLGSRGSTISTFQPMNIPYYSQIFNQGLQADTVGDLNKTKIDNNKVSNAMESSSTFNSGIGTPLSTSASEFSAMFHSLNPLSSQSTTTVSGISMQH